ncbi:MAG: hypothetical protein F4Y91_12890 [Gemmatimonadetes bacterium]|nr:hypothetical protein [Gemmatimonadota bacterium]MXY82919.1 hypothetical protein [Gemmatimonadota bacterium]MYB68567.1 hypothetical protein [Gemmatimonadota bacterium]
MNHRSILIVCLAMLGLAVDGWGQGWDKIAFVSNRDGLPNIWIMNADGSDPVNLTKGRGICLYPAWSPDGMTIAYINGDGHGKDEIWLMDADGSNPQQVTDDAVHKAGLAWSEDGSRIYYDTLPTGHPKDGTESFVIGLEDGSGALPVDAEEGAIARMWPRSPDGTKSMVVLREGDQTDIYVVDNSGDERTSTRLTDSPNVDISPAWSPDGMRIVFASGPSMGGPMDIWVVDIDGSNLVNLTNGLGGGWPAWRPASPAATSVEAQSWGQIKSLLSIGTH